MPSLADLMSPVSTGAKALADLVPEKKREMLLAELGKTWPAKMAKSAAGAAMLPGDVYQGNVTPNDPDYYSRATDLAGLVMGGSYAAPAMNDATGVGIRAYHGSHAPIEQFDRPAYFSPSRQYAEKFGKVHEVDVSPKNPYYTQDQMFVEGLRSFPERADALRKAGHDAVIFSGSKDSVEPILGLGGYIQPQIYSLDPSIVAKMK